MLVTLIIFLTGTLSSAYVTTGRGDRSIEMSDVLVNTNIITEFPNVLSGVRCVDLCLQNVACVSVFYRRQHRRCQLHDVLFLSPQDGEEEAGTVYYSVRTDDCPSGYVHNRLLNICYHLHLDKQTYDKAQADCASKGEHFVVIDNEGKQDHIVKQMNSSVTSSCNYIIDGSDADTEGQWVFHDGRNMTFFSWAPGFPESGRYRTRIIAKKDISFLWENRVGNDKCYICEKDM